MFNPASRAEIDPFIVMQMMSDATKREAAGDNVLHLEIGQPSTPAPKGVLKAARVALCNDKIGYTVPLGMTKMREKISKHYRKWYGIEVSIERIAVTTGSSGGFSIAVLSALEHGSRVAIASPGYPAYRNILKSLGTEVVCLPADAKDRFQPTVAKLEKAGKLDGLIIASPSNPTGTMLNEKAMKKITHWCQTNGVRLISDEVYHGINFRHRPISALESNPDAIVINSFSKYFSMTGWRIGWMVIPPELLTSVERLIASFFISAPTISQFGAIAAFDCIEEAQKNLNRYTLNRDILLNQLPSAWLDNLAPADGAFYIYANVAKHTNDSRKFCKRLLTEIGIACTPGIDFDPSRGHATIRLSFAGSSKDMMEACKRLKAWL
ncbi:aminotransferase, classes I and II [Candidatus Endolissoclinum faulkneri L2]|uniref:Aminotransferase n=1 Tax=Candidatus Endolissoclinum faulkneri L2 TaxID=1193729 RepID=K7YGC3_9PROT|nr:aminotransferase class I/II-fold pyridoxal phosphate-dependent enzyme [Candidatus Endolissoclinum faulkneri]AFX98660.1 aminotransferase, classes I and II [Candidatus Endolissoclinum faulkneri L2]